MMKQFLLFAISFLFFNTTYAQEGLSIEASYPIPIGDNFLAENFSGLFDIGAEYIFLDTERFNVGFALNVNQARFKEEVTFRVTQLGQAMSTTVRVSSTMWSPKFYIEAPLNKFKPNVGLGYSFFSLKTKEFEAGDQLIIPENNEDYDGLNLNVALPFNISEHLFVQGQYDYFNDKQTTTTEVIDSGGNTPTSGGAITPTGTRSITEGLGSLSFLKLGVGYRF